MEVSRGGSEEHCCFEEQWLSSCDSCHQEGRCGECPRRSSSAGSHGSSGEADWCCSCCSSKISCSWTDSGGRGGPLRGCRPDLCCPCFPASGILPLHHGSGNQSSLPDVHGSPRSRFLETQTDVKLAIAWLVVFLHNLSTSTSTSPAVLANHDFQRKSNSDRRLQRKRMSCSLVPTTLPTTAKNTSISERYLVLTSVPKSPPRAFLISLVRLPAGRYPSKASSDHSDCPNSSTWHNLKHNSFVGAQYRSERGVSTCVLYSLDRKRG